MIFEGVLYFGWPDQPSSGTMEDFTLVRVIVSPLFETAWPSGQRVGLAIQRARV